MTDLAAPTICVICGADGTTVIDPPKRTFARGADPSDTSYSIIAVLPDIHLCDEHAAEVTAREVSVGWCDDERCRLYGETGEASPCGEAFKELRR